MSGNSWSTKRGSCYYSTNRETVSFGLVGVVTVVVWSTYRGGQFEGFNCTNQAFVSLWLLFGLVLHFNSLAHYTRFPLPFTTGWSLTGFNVTEKMTINEIASSVTGSKQTAYSTNI